MFLSNKYTKWYFNIIESAQDQKYDEYVEKHHIIPKSLGGSDLSSNIVILTYKQHFICHWLLTKMVNGDNKRKMYYALSMMRRRKNQTENLSTWRIVLLKQASKISNTGKKISEETKTKLRQFALEQRQNPIYIEKWQRGMDNRILPPVSDERKETYRKNRIKYNKSNDHRIIVSQTMKGKPKSEDQKNKQSQSMKGRQTGENNSMANPESRLKVSMSKIGKRALYKDGKRKMALPNSEKWNELVQQGYV